MLSVTGLTCQRGGLPVLEGVTLALAPKEVLILRGPNGSGKTTLLRTLAGLQPAPSGSIEFAADSIAYAGHADGIKATLSVAENLEFWAGIYGAKDIEYALQAFEITPLRNQEAKNLSAGQKRRLGLARLLVTGRPIWLLDEPTVSLDATSIGLFAKVARVHAEAGGAALIATHVDLGLEARSLDVSTFRAGAPIAGSEFDEAFL